MARVDIKIKMTNNIYTNLGRGHCPKYLILCNRTLNVITLLIKIDHIAINPPNIFYDWIGFHHCQNQYLERVTST